MTKEYLAIKNFFHNTQQLNNTDLRLLLKDIVSEVIEEKLSVAIRDYLESDKFLAVIAKTIKQYRYATFPKLIDDAIKYSLQSIISDALATIIKDKVDISVKLTSPESKN